MHSMIYAILSGRQPQVVLDLSPNTVSPIWSPHTTDLHL